MTIFAIITITPRSRALKQLALITIFVAAAWLIAVAVYALYECTLLDKGYDPTTSANHREGLINALNYAFPIAVGCLLFILRTNKTDPLGAEMFLLCMITAVLATFLVLKAKEQAFPNHSSEFTKAIWWLPNAEEVDMDDF